MSAQSVGSEMFRANPQAQQFVALLSAIYRNLAPLYDPDDALFKDANAWGKVLRDERFRAYIQQRLAKVARINWVMDPASDRECDVQAAATVEPFLRELPAFTASRRHLAKFAFWGKSHLWIEGKREWRVAGTSAKFKEGLLAEWWVPTYLRPLDKRQVIYQPETRLEDGREVVHVKTLLGTIDARKHVEMQHPECLVTCVYDDEVERLGYGRGLLETLYHCYWIKGVVRRIGLSGLEKWAHGIVLAKLDSQARGAVDETTADVAQQMLDTIHAMRNDGVVVVDKNDEIQVLKTDGQGQDATHRWLQYLDEGAAQLCLSAVRPMGGKEGGAYNQAETENKSTEDLLDCDRELIDEQITRSVVRLWWDLNAANVFALGLGEARCPRFRSVGLTDQDPEKAVRVIEGAQRAGMQISVADAHRMTGLKRPAKGEAILEAPKSDASLFSNMGDTFGGEGGTGGGRPPGIERSDMRERGALAALAALVRRIGRRAS